MDLTIIHENGDRKGARQIFAGKAIVRIGRHLDNDCELNSNGDRGVSSFHAELRIEDGRVRVVDTGSTNGVFVNAVRVSDAFLSPTDLVELGEGGPAFRVEGAPPMPAGEKKYGQRTVGMMIESALARAGLARKGGTSKSTEYFEALVEKKVRRTSAVLRWTIAASVLVLAAAGTASGVYLYRNRSVQVVQTTQVNYGDATGSAVAAANRYTIFMLAGQPRLPQGFGPLQGFCSAFAVKDDVLATNAHCVRVASEQFAGIVAIMNGVPAGRYPVSRMVAHPGYVKGEISPDVGLMRVAARLPYVVSIAPATELAQIAPGAPMFLYGFPGRLNREDAPEATFVNGDIGRVTTFDQRLGNFGENTLLQHSAFSTGGTSGSPMFNSAGRVIGINAGGYLEGAEVLHGYNFGMRIDLIEPLFAMLGSG
ncbi:MAG: trypsin-like peptidase domain-containing protein [Deltaproteobacteria bacterium]|nr:trypsin-like peptidase domain-containing protein [Deltaproteobacteria bacterium]